MITMEFLHTWPNQKLFRVFIQSRIDSDGAFATSVAYLQHTGNVLAIVNIDIQFFMDLNDGTTVLPSIAIGPLFVFELRCIH